MLSSGVGRQEDLLKYRKLKDDVEYSEWYYEEERKKQKEELEELIEPVESLHEEDEEELGIQR